MLAVIGPFTAHAAATIPPGQVSASVTSDGTDADWIGYGPYTGEFGIAIYVNGVSQSSGHGGGTYPANNERPWVNTNVEGNWGSFGDGTYTLIDYGWSAPFDCSAKTLAACLSDGKSGSYVQFTRSGGVWSVVAPITDTSTRIVVTLPENGVTVATTSIPILIGGDIYVNSADYADNMILYGLYKRANQYNNDAALGIPSLGDSRYKSGGEFRIPITNDGASSLSTTSEAYLRGGAYILDEKIMRPKPRLFEWLPFDFFYDTLAATSTVWAIGTTTAFDIKTLTPEQQVALTGTSTPSFAVPDSCSPLSTSFSLDQCITYWLVPDSVALVGTFNTFEQNVLTHAPWGYVYRFVTILIQSTVEEALPTYSVHILPNAAADGLTTFSPGEMLTSGAAALTSIQDPIYGKTLREITEPWIQLFIALSVLIIIFHDLMAMGHHTKHPPSSK